ncbi:hypothetical protein J1N35_036785 [Gossypium stocksii]|uniref:Uncharacterized protein n=1 Tax=Gossypium stocksii TaxID=47602 RepID=A0A9D3UIZ6_9ROSI|nr:hypothetical protein J1N35_036785 [Gossypium stocksii]
MNAYLVTMYKKEDIYVELKTFRIADRLTKSFETTYCLFEDKSFGSYNFFLNIYEDFAMHCKIGMAMSNQTAGLFGFNLVYHATKGIHEAFTN